MPQSHLDFDRGVEFSLIACICLYHVVSVLAEGHLCGGAGEVDLKRALGWYANSQSLQGMPRVSMRWEQLQWLLDGVGMAEVLGRYDWSTCLCLMLYFSTLCVLRSYAIVSF